MHTEEAVEKVDSTNNRVKKFVPTWDEYTMCA